MIIPTLNLEFREEHSDIDAIITLGDLTYFEIRDLESINSVPKLGVYGNHDARGYMEQLGIINLDSKVYQINGITLVGFEGSIRYKENPDAIMLTQEESLLKAESLPNADILICHSPPFGIHDQDDLPHNGLNGINRYIEKHSPKHMLHGHTYVPKGTKS